MPQISPTLIEIKRITAKETYPVRHTILRKGRPIEDCQFEGDELETTFHFGLFHKKDIIGVATFLKNNNLLLLQESQYQLRGMAISENYQGQSLGKILLDYAEKFLKDKSITILWCNAREAAKKFYIRNDYKVIGEPFIIPKIGLHYIMYKQVTNT